MNGTLMMMPVGQDGAAGLMEPWEREGWEYVWVSATWESGESWGISGFMTWCPPFPSVADPHVTPRRLHAAGLVRVDEAECIPLLVGAGCGCHVTDRQGGGSWWAHPSEVATAQQQRIILGFPMPPEGPGSWSKELPPATYGTIALRLDTQQITCIALQGLAPAARLMQMEMAESITAAYQLWVQGQTELALDQLDALYPVMAALRAQYSTYICRPTAALPLEEGHRGPPLTRPRYRRLTGSP